jgi:hypothetical protein
VHYDIRSTPNPDWNFAEEIERNNSKLEDANQANQKVGRLF